MSDPKNEPNQSTVLPEAETAKKSYEKPEIVFQAPLEATAGQCDTRPPGKADISCSVTSS